MPEFDLTPRLIEQMKPITATLQQRLQASLSDRDNLAVANAMQQAAVMGMRVALASMLADLAEAGIALPSNLSLTGLESQDFWPFPD
jgi:hypothetical protein